MPRTRRYIESGCPYEICLRVRKGLPFPAWALIKLILDSALARVQRDSKVTLCHRLWMANHLHLILIAWDAQQCVNFYQELQKKITESFKRLLGKKHLKLWEGAPAVAKIDDLDKMIERIAYIYANPARANLTDTTSEYPHLSSWAEFNQATTIHQTFSQEVPWVRLPTIEKLPSLKLTPKQDQHFTNALKEASTYNHTLITAPNAWMECFGVEERDVQKINHRILQHLSIREDAARLKRKDKRLVGAYRLKTEAINWEHTPAKKDRRIYILATLKERRIEFINFMKALTLTCKELYQKARQGVLVSWPPGVFVPWLSPRASVISF